jgi:hypothetical protein
MTTILSTASTISVVSASYSLPAPGQATLLGTNVANDIKPSTHTNDAWNYSLMESYGGGSFVASFSSHGAYVIAGTGGHNAPPNFGAAVFDFADATWKRIDNANGMPWRSSDIVAGGGEYDSAAEISISGVTPNAVPLPSHTYMHAEEIPSSQGGGPRGSILLSCSLSGSSNGNNSSMYSHRFDLSTGMWSRLSTNRMDAAGAYIDFWAEGTTVRDSQTGRYWAFTYRCFADNPIYMDPGTWTWKSQSWNGGSDIGWVHGSAWFDPARRLILWNTDNGLLRGVAVDNISSGIKTLARSGVDMPTQYGRGNRWAYSPDHDAFFGYGGSGQTIYKLTPPSSNPLTNTWTVTSQGITGATLASSTSQNNTRSYSRFFYVPALRCLAWIANTSSRVALIKPS